MNLLDIRADTTVTPKVEIVDVQKDAVRMQTLSATMVTYTAPNTNFIVV